MARLILETELSQEECFRSIVERTTPWSLRRWGLSDGFAAKVAPPDFKLTRSRFVANPLRGIFYGRIVAAAGRTRVLGRLGVPLFGLLFVSFCLALGAALGLPLLNAVPGLHSLEFRLVACWAVLLGLFRVAGAWDFGGPEDPYATFLSEILQPARTATSSHGHSQD
jgi:hypothetical protein